MSDRLISSDPGFYQDLNSLNNIKGNPDKRAGLETVAGQFEVQFLQMVLKNMRAASDALADEDSPVSSQQQRFYRDMYDSQLSMALAKHGGIGIKDSMIRQLEPTLKNSGDPVAVNETTPDSLRQSWLPLPPARNTE